MKIRFADLVTRRGFVAAVGALTGGGLATAAAGAQAAPKAAEGGTGKIGVVSVQEAIGSTAEGKAAAAQLQSQFAPRSKELQDIQNQINELNTRLRTGDATLSEEEKARISSQVNTMTQSGQRKMQDLQDDQQAAENDIIDSIGRKLEAVLDKYATENGYSVILDIGSQNTSVFWAAPSVIITQQVVQLYDSSNPVKAGATSSAPSSTPRSSTTTPRSSTPSTTPK